MTNPTPTHGVVTGYLLFEHFATLATAPDGIARLRELILQLAVQGKLGTQDAGDELASVLLKRICSVEKISSRSREQRLTKRSKVQCLLILLCSVTIRRQ